MKKLFTTLRYFVVLGCVLSVGALRASDHDDGEIDEKGRALNLTDLYVFREDWQTDDNVVGDDNTLVVIMNSNPRSLPGQQYFFSTNARYEVHFSRVPVKNVAPTGESDVTLRFSFGDPVATANPLTNNRQPISFVAIKDGDATTASPAASPAYTHNIVESAAETVGSSTFTGTAYTVGGVSGFRVAAGLRQDPFFFDVNGFFKTRYELAANAGTAGDITAANVLNFVNFASPFPAYNATSADFTAYYNVNTIAIKLPISYLQSGTPETVFDVWETISVEN